MDVTRFAAAQGVTRSYMTRVLRLAFLSPDVVEGLLSGRQRVGISVAALCGQDAIAPDWRDQHTALLSVVGARWRR